MDDETRKWALAYRWALDVVEAQAAGSENNAALIDMSRVLMDHWEDEAGLPERTQALINLARLLAEGVAAKTESTVQLVLHDLRIGIPTQDN